MNRWWLCSVALLLVGQTGCFAGFQTERTTETVQATGTLVVENRGGQALHYVYFSPVRDRNWGDDQLGAQETIARGQSRGWAVPAGRYHLRVKFADGQSLEGTDEYRVRRGETTLAVVRGGNPAPPPPPPARTGALRVENRSGKSIQQVFFSLVHERRWGGNQLVRERIRHQRSRRWQLAPGRYHVKVVMSDGQVLDSLEEYRVRPDHVTTCTIR
jgi:hypothetical protein